MVTWLWMKKLNDQEDYLRQVWKAAWTPPRERRAWGRGWWGKHLRPTTIPGVEDNYKKEGKLKYLSDKWKISPKWFQRILVLVIKFNWTWNILIVTFSVKPYHETIQQPFYDLLTRKSIWFSQLKIWAQQQNVNKNRSQFLSLDLNFLLTNFFSNKLFQILACTNQVVCLILQNIMAYLHSSHKRTER